MARDVRMPDGTLVRNVPDGLSRDEFLGRLKSAGYDVDRMLSPAQRAEAAKPTTPPPVETKPEEAPEEGRSWYGLSKKGLTEGFGTQLAEGAKQGVGGVRQAAIDALPDSIDQLPPGLTYEEVDRVGGVRAYWEQVYGIKSNEQLKAIKQQATSRLKEERKASEARVAAATPEDLTLLETGIRGGAESIVRNLPGIAASIATRNPLPALTSAGLQTGTEAYGEARAEGLTPGQASRYAGIDAAIEVGTELLPTKFLLGAFGAKSLDGVKGQLLKFAAGEMTGEQIATATQSLNAYLNDLDQELEAAKTPGEKLEIQAKRQALTGIATIVSGGTFAAGAAAAGAVAERRARDEAPPVPEEGEPEAPVTAEAPQRRELARPPEAPPVSAELTPALRGLEELEVPPEVTEGPPPAVVEDAQALLKLADEGKSIALFRAKSLARQLGVELDKSADKETTLNALRDALALTAVEAVTPTAEVPLVDVLAGKDIRPPTDDVYEVADANFNYPRMIGNDTVPIEQLKGGVSEQSGERKRVNELAKQISGDDGYFSRIIVDQNNNVIEGQHRLEALRQLGAKEVPVFKIEDMGDTYPAMKMEAAVKKAQPMREEQASQIVKQAMNAIAETGSVQGAYKLEIPGFQKGYLAALNVIEPKAPKAEVPSEPVRGGVGEVVAGAAPRGVELPVPRERPARPEITEPAVSGLEPVSTAAPRVDEGKAVEPTALEPVRKLPDIKTQTVYRGGPRSTLASFPANVTAEDVVRYEVEELGNAETIKAAPNIDLKTIPANQLEWVTFDKKFAERYADVDAGETVEGREETFRVIATDADGGYLIQRLPSTSEQRFLSLDDLNRTTPALPEQTKERAPSLRRGLSKSLRQYDEGKINADRFANDAGMLLLMTQKQRVAQPRQRGPEFIRERLMNASRNGALDPQGVEIASWFVQQNPVLVDDLAISIRQRPEDMQGTAAFYNPVNRMVTLFKEAGDERTAVHEILHHTERMMPANIRAGLFKAYTRQLLKAQKAAKTPEERQFFKAIVDQQLGEGSPAAYRDALDAIKNARINKDNYQYVNPSEFWAVNASRIVQNRYGVPPTITGQLKRWLREFLEKAKSVLGLSSDAAVIRALDSLVKADGKYKTEAMLALAPEYEAPEPGKKPHDIEDFRPEALSESKLRDGTRNLVKNFGNGKLFENLVEKFQNKHRYIDKLDEDKALQGTLIITGPDRNNIASEIARAPNIADAIIVQRVEPAIREAQEAIKDFAAAAGLGVKAATNKLSKIMVALHEQRRRETKYLREVPLRNDIKIPSANLPFVPAGTANMTPADYRAFLETQRSKLPPEQAAQIQDVMRALVNKFKSETGYSPVGVRGKKMSTDINNKIYDVIPREIDGKPFYTPEALQAKIAEYENSGRLKPFIDNVRAKVRRVHEIERELSKEANYWPSQVDSIVASYQWGDTYVPFQGIPESDKDYDYGSDKLSGELAEVAQSWEGRATDFDDVILQSFANAYQSASQASRKDLMPVLVNNVKQGFLKVKSKEPEVVTFEQRSSPDFDYSILRGKRKILDYKPNGDVHVYELMDDKELEAIKTPYRETSPIVKIFSDFNSLVGQFHTRFNLNFPPVDFLVNSMTNLGLITSKEGFGQGGKYAAEVISNVLRSGMMVKSANFSRALSSKDPAVLQKLLKSKDSFYRDALDFWRYGGRSLYRQGFTTDQQIDELVQRVKPNMLLKTKEELARYFDIFNDMFEFTSRVAAYTTRLDDNVAKARKNNINVDDPAVMADLKREAAGFALELMDFRKMGRFGKEMSAFFMFFKPAATGAVNFIKVLRTATTNVETAIKNANPRVWAQMDTRYDEEALAKEEAKPKSDREKIAALQAQIAKKNENRRKFIENYNQSRKNAFAALPVFFAAGATMYALAMAMAPDDDEGRNMVATDEMNRWTRYMRLPIPLPNDEMGFFQVPWGFGAGAFAAAGAQFAALGAGNLKFEDFASNMIEIGLDSFVPVPASRINMTENFPAWLLTTIAPSAARPFLEYSMNMDSLGRPIYDARIGKYAEAYSGGSRASEWHNWAAKTLLDVSNGQINWDPDTIAFVLNNYADGPNAIAENIFNSALVLSGEKEIDLKRDIPFIKRFIGTQSNYDAAQFRDAEKWIKSKASIYRTFREDEDPAKLERFLEANPNIDILSEIYDDVINGQLREIGERQNQVKRDRYLTPKERKEYLDDLQYNEDAIKRNFVETYEYYRYPTE